MSHEEIDEIIQTMRNDYRACKDKALRKCMVVLANYLKGVRANNEVLDEGMIQYLRKRYQALRL